MSDHTDLGQAGAEEALQALLSNMPDDVSTNVAAAQRPIAAIQTIVESLRSFLPGLYKDPDTGKTRAFGKLGSRSPGSISDAIEDALDKEFQSDVINPLKEELHTKTNDMLESYFLWRYDDPERAAAEAKRPALERLAVKGLLFFRGDHVALRGLSAYLNKLGYSDYSAGPGADRRRKALTSIASELYRQATDLSLASPFRGEGVKDNMQALLGMFDAGAFKQLLNKGGVFDQAGNLTESGQTLLSQSVTNASRSVFALSKITGQKSAVKSLQVAQEIFGQGILKQLDDDQTANSLNQFRAMARMNGMDSKQSMQLLATFKRHFPRATDPAPLLAMAAQKLSFNRIGSWYSSGDPRQWDRLTMGMAAGIGKTKFSRAAAAGAAALEQEYGRPAAWNIMDNALLRGIASPGRLIGVVNSHLGEPITTANLNNFLNSPSAYAYFRSGRMFPAMMTRSAGLLYKEMGKRSAWARTNLPLILRRYGELSPDTLVKYLKDNNASVQDTGKVMGHMRQLAASFTPNLGTGDMATQMSLVTGGWKHGSRQRILQESGRRGDLAATLRNVRGGGDAPDTMARTLGLSGNIWKSLWSGVTGDTATARPDQYGARRIPYIPPPKPAPRVGLGMVGAEAADLGKEGVKRAKQATKMATDAVSGYIMRG